MRGFQSKPESQLVRNLPFLPELESELESSHFANSISGPESRMMFRQPMMICPIEYRKHIEMHRQFWNKNDIAAVPFVSNA